MKKLSFLLSLSLPLAILSLPANAETATEETASEMTVETAAEAVVNMGYGWNLGNTLESNSGDTANMWMERWTNPITTASYETQWGQPVTTRALIHMIHEAGFGVVRVPVTWFPHMGMQITYETRGGTSYGVWHQSQWEPTAVDAAWMARVKEVVDYVIDEGMYCILNVHHDTGASSTAWLHTTMQCYNEVKDTYIQLWTEIANEFKDYDEHLLFEGYNEMLDDYDSWCFASFNAPGNYNATAAADAYQAINSYAAAFVGAVRATGGNNTYRNLLMNTYGGCGGLGSWNTHLTDPLSQLSLPTDPCGNQDHLIAGLHSYPSLKSGNNWMTTTQMQTQNKEQFQKISQYLQSAKGYPVIIGEWGSSSPDSNDAYDQNQSLYLAFVKDFMTRARVAGVAPIYWMGISDTTHRSVPEVNQQPLADAMRDVYSALPDTPSETSSAVRIFRNGQICIRREGRLYDLMGRLVEE